MPVNLIEVLNAIIIVTFFGFVPNTTHNLALAPI